MTADAFRILVIDDNAAIRDLFHAIFTPRQDHDDEFARLQSQLLGEAPKAERRRQFAVDLAANGKEGHSRLAQAHAEGQPYAAAFVDMRMPGWDGLTTVEALWRVDPELQVVLCSAYSDYAWDDMAARLGNSDRWLVLKNLSTWSRSSRWRPGWRRAGNCSGSSAAMCARWSRTWTRSCASCSAWGAGRASSRNAMKSW